MIFPILFCLIAIFMKEARVNSIHGNSELPLLCSDVKSLDGRQSGAFITRDPGKWTYRADGSMEYDLKTCRLHRYTADEARQCLAGHHLLMIGDSLTRYQYLGLVYLLEQGRYPPRFGMGDDSCKHFDADGHPTCSPQGSPNPLMETDWGAMWGHSPDKSWKQLHMWLGGIGFNHRLECQCVRNQLDSSVENMFYESVPRKAPGAAVGPPSLSDKVIRITSFLNLGSQANISGWSRTFCSSNSTCNMTEEWWKTAHEKGKNHEFDFTFDFERDPEGMLGDAMEELAPGIDIAMYNRGLWGPANRNHTNRVLRAMYQLTAKNWNKKRNDGSKGGKCFWKGTTALAYSHILPTRKVGKAVSLWAKEQSLRTSAYGAGCGVYDLAHVTKEFMKYEWNGDVGRNECCGESEGRTVFWDAVHYQPWVYEEFNNILLNVLC